MAKISVRQVKERMVEALAHRWKGVRNFLLVDYRGIPAAQAARWRRAMRAEGIGVVIAKNSIGERALRKIGQEKLAEKLEGMNAFVYGDDAAVMAKKCVELLEEGKTAQLRLGVVEGLLFNPEQLTELARLPSRKELQGALCGALAAPLTGFAGALNAVATSFVLALKAVVEKQERQG